MMPGHADTGQGHTRKGKPTLALLRQKIGRVWNPPDKDPTVLLISEDEGEVYRFLDDDIEDMTAKYPELANYRLHEGDSRSSRVTIGDDVEFRVVYTLLIPEGWKRMKNRDTIPWMSPKEIPVVKLVLGAWRKLRKDRDQVRHIRECAEECYAPDLYAEGQADVIALRMEYLAAVNKRLHKEARDVR